MVKANNRVMNDRNKILHAQGHELGDSVIIRNTESTKPLIRGVRPSVVEDVTIPTGPTADTYRAEEIPTKMREDEKLRSRGNYAYFTRNGYPISVISSSHISEMTETTKNSEQVHATNQITGMENQMVQKLIYEPLAQGLIRVVDLLPGAASDPIRVNLRAMTIDGPESFEALSYTWGKEACPCKISVDGHDFTVTRNLFAALMRFRKDTDTRTLWIDAIAINQSSLEERTQQVRLMPDIYSKANRVLAWLGESRNDAALETLFNVAHERHDYAQLKSWLELPEGDIPLLLFSQDSRCMRIVRAVHELFHQRQNISGLHKHVLPAWYTELNNSPFIFIGYRNPPSSYNSSSAAMTIMPDFELDQVQLSALQSFPSFEEFLIDAAKPSFLRLSDEKMLEVFDGLGDLLNRPYWQRAWIVQEVIASRKCTLYFSKPGQEIDIELLGSVYGFDKRNGIDIRNFTLEDFCMFDATKHVAVLRRLFALRSIAFNNFDNWSIFSQLTYNRVSRTSHWLRPTWKFGRLLSWYAGQEATDLRDKIFSLMGLLQLYSISAEEIDWSRRIVDYKLDVRSVYIKAAQHLVECYQQRGRDDPKIISEHVLDQFYQTRDQNSNPERLPTWVPNWASETDQPVTFNTWRMIEIDVLIPYDAHVSGDSLILSGHQVDEVSWVSDEVSTDEKMYDEVDMWLKILENDWGAVYGSNDARFDAFWRTAIVDNPQGGKDSRDLTYHFKSQVQVEKWLRHCRDNLARLYEIWGDRLQDRSRLRPIMYDPEGHSQATHPASPMPSSFTLRQPNMDSRSHLTVPRDEVAQRSIAEAMFTKGADHEPTWEALEARMELSRRHFVVSKKGYFGLGSPGVRVGDSITLLAGSACPWYLRYQGEGRHVVSARGWVCGLMYRRDEYYSNWETKRIERIILE